MFTLIESCVAHRVTEAVIWIARLTSGSHFATGRPLIHRTVMEWKGIWVDMMLYQLYLRNKRADQQGTLQIPNRRSWDSSVILPQRTIFTTTFHLWMISYNEPILLLWRPIWHTILDSPPRNCSHIYICFVAVLFWTPLLLPFHNETNIVFW